MDDDERNFHPGLVPIRSRLPILSARDRELHQRVLEDEMERQIWYFILISPEQGEVVLSRQ